LYEAFALFIGFFVLWPLRKKIKTPGVILSIYVIYYSVVRFLNEFLRFDAAPIGPLNISPSQNIALVLFVLALILLINRLKLYSKLK
jgi:phosphatidylglycerol:prolipoprotein diacylglycerol transferase